MSGGKMNGELDLFSDRVRSLVNAVGSGDLSGLKGDDLTREQFEAVAGELSPTVPDDAELLGSLARARQDLNAKLDEGVHCPCCGAFSKRYRRGLNRTMIGSLRWIVQQSGERRQWINVPETAPKWILRSNQLPTLALWGLVEKQRNEDPTKASSGIWRPTAKGVEFSSGRCTVERFALVYRNEVEALVEPFVFAEEICDDFDFRKLMENAQ